MPFSGPYYCAQANFERALGECLETPSLINPGYLADVTRATAATGTIDDPANMDGDRIYLFSGLLDTTVKPGQFNL